MTHFYTETPNGVEPRHFVPMAKDPSQLRPSRTTDAKKAIERGEVWYPSVTSVIGILDKPALVNWKVDKHLEQAFTMTPESGEELESYLSRVKRVTQEKLDEAPQAGSDIHKVLENNLFVDENELDDGLSSVELQIIRSVEHVLLEQKIHAVTADMERYFVSKGFGYAGCADLCSSGWVIDYKSKQEASKFKPGKMAYPEHARQLAAYGHALYPGESFRAANIFICLETGEIDFHEHDTKALESAWLDFVDCLSIYKRNVYEAKA